MKPPRDWIDPWPHGTPAPGAPRAAAWVAHLATLTRERDRAELAAATGLDERTIQRINDGTAWPTLRTATALADHLARREHPPDRR